jgi:TonB family protein
MTKIFRLTLLLIFCRTVSFSQTTDSSLYYYNLANKALTNKNLILADTLYSKSLKFLKHPDTYYNRAVIRKENKNIIGYCSDIQSAANLGDTISYDEFWKNCGTVDTIHYMQGSTNETFGNYAIIKKGLYNKFEDYKKLNLKGVVLLHYFVDQNDTVYIGGAELEEIKIDSLKPEKEVMKFVSRKVVYPQLAKEKGIQGTVIISFILNKEGAIENPTIIKGLPYGLSEEALSVVKSFPRWKPFVYHGKPIKKRVEIPIKFTLK